MFNEEWVNFACGEHHVPWILAKGGHRKQLNRGAVACSTLQAGAWGAEHGHLRERGTLCPPSLASLHVSSKYNTPPDTWGTVPRTPGAC